MSDDGLLIGKPPLGGDARARSDALVLEEEQAEPIAHPTTVERQVTQPATPGSDLAGLAAFSKPRTPSTSGTEYNDGVGMWVPTTSKGPIPTDSVSDPLAELCAELEANTWARQGEQLAARIARRVSGEERPIKTPWEGFNEAMGGGLWPGVHFLVGGTGTGKSQWAMQATVFAAAVHGTPVLYLALELDALGLFSRAVSFVSGADGNKLAWSALYTGKQDAPADAVEALKSLPVHWMVTPPHGWKYDRLGPTVRALRALHPEHTGSVLVVLDFLQLVAGGDREDLRERIGKAAYQARAVARDLDAAVLVLSSTSREGYKQARVEGKPDEDGLTRDGRFAMKRPHPSELVGLGKESGDVEYAADSVLVLCPESYPEGERPPEGKRVHLAVSKLRAGVPEWVVLAFDGTTFVEVTEQEEPETIPAEHNGKPRKSKPKGARYGNGKPVQGESDGEW